MRSPFGMDLGAVATRVNTLLAAWGYRRRTITCACEGPAVRSPVAVSVGGTQVLAGFKGMTSPVKTALGGWCLNKAVERHRTHGCAGVGLGLACFWTCGSKNRGAELSSHQVGPRNGPVRSPVGIDG
jgi:hypothetical protein